MRIGRPTITPSMSAGHSNTTCAPLAPVPASDVALDVVMNVGTYVTAAPQIFKLCRASTSDGVSFSTCMLTVGLLSMQLSAAILTKWKQISACADVGLARCVPDLLDATSLLALDLANLTVLVQVALLPPTNGKRHHLLAAGALIGTAVSWSGCVALSLVVPCGRTARSLADAFAYAGAVIACLQYVPQLLLTCRHRSSGSLSIPTYAFQVVGGLALLLGQLGADDPWPVWAPMLLSTTLQAVVTLLCIWFDTARWVRQRVTVRQAAAEAQAAGEAGGAAAEPATRAAGAEPLLPARGAPG